VAVPAALVEADTVVDGVATDALGAGEATGTVEVELAVDAAEEVDPSATARLEPQPAMTNARSAAALRTEECMILRRRAQVPGGSPAPTFRYR
jgi:hypothetical protein